METTNVADLSAHAALSFTEAPTGGTSILPAFHLASDATMKSDNPRTVIALTDTLVTDATAQQTSEIARTLRATSMTVITPSGVAVTDAWNDAFAWEYHTNADPDSAGSTSLAVAAALAHATGQRVTNTSTKAA